MRRPLLNAPGAGRPDHQPAALAKWNADNPDTPIKISMPQIVKRVRDMRATREQRIQKATPKELRAG